MRVGITGGTGFLGRRVGERLLEEGHEVVVFTRDPASGEGTHVYFTIEKRGLTTPAAIGLIARRLGKKPRDIGYAGLKDAHGITRQTLSV